MSGPFRVERIEGCGQCGHGVLFDVIGPDDVAHSTQYGDEEEANSVRDGFDRAYELGKQAGLLQANNWTAFSETELPPDSSSILVWDAEYNNISSSYWITSIHNIETAQKLKWSHWILVNKLIAPPPGATTEPPTPPEADPVPTLAAAPESATQESAPDWTDDIPF